jgi:TM2 domain-containing membrane protein YozV
MGSTTQEKILIEQRVGNEGPSILLAYVLWVGLGFFSAHRFYLGRTRSAILQIVLNCLLVGLIWGVIDLFLIPGMVRAKQDALRARLTQDLAPAHEAAGAAPPGPAHA